MPADLAPLTVIPRGFGGSAMADVLHFVDRVAIAYQPRAVVIYEGDNDTGRFMVPPAKIAAELEQIIAAVHAELPETRVYVMSVKPSLARVAFWDQAQEANALYREVAAADDRVHYIDVATPVPAGGRDGHGRHLHRRRPAPEREGHAHLGLDHQGGP